jgi:hypothetical protein
MEFSYSAIQISQTKSEKWLTLFGAAADEIDAWAGVPQKKKFVTGEETAGFQREENKDRVKSLREFYLNEDNVIQNPLLCAVRNLPQTTVQFTPNAGEDGALARRGTLQITMPEVDKLSFQEILEEVRAYIESRLPDVQGTVPHEDLVARLKAQAAETDEMPPEEEEDRDDDDNEDGTEDNEGDTVEEEVNDVSSVLFEESHFIDFWNEIAARHEVAKLIGEPIHRDDFLGFSRDALLSYLKPIVLVDGQHRLRGALQAADTIVNTTQHYMTEAEKRIQDGEDADHVVASLISKEARQLPISLIMSDDPAEQVFQFVVVNQKATPVGKALLGTIVSTTLSNEEMESVAGRLRNAGIEVEQSQAITFLARHPESPFCDLIERGLAGDENGRLLKWNVFSSLISIFRDLSGGKLWGERNDYAQKWEQRCLHKSAIVGGFSEAGFDQPKNYWRSLDGPWRDVFIRFFVEIRDRFGDTEDADRHNYWGDPRGSNLFNKISLTILAADFFQFLHETKQPIGTAQAVCDLVEEWLDGVKPTYFDKDWQLSNIKKDSTDIRKNWAKLWSDYRKGGGGNLPDRRNYSARKID